MTRRLFDLFLLLSIANIAYGETARDLPSLSERGEKTQLIVDEQAFLMLGGELGNSSASSAAYMAPIWPRLQEANLNTVLAPVYWELIEPTEGQLDFSSVDQLIKNARMHEQKLVLLWFATWKNSMSTYVPAWVKTDQARFPRARDENGVSQDILTPFSNEVLDADRDAFIQLMRHIRKVDEQEQTVILVQIENEVGMLPSARDHHPLANKAFGTNVPAALMQQLEKRREHLAPWLRSVWMSAGGQSTGSWETVFGSGAPAEEIFMAWHYARFVNAIADAGKEVYALPMFVNAALNRPGREPGSGYPSAGPLPHLADIWKAGAPAIDFLAPDFYTPRFKHWNDLYAVDNNPLFIPEHRFDATAAPKALYAIGHYAALGFAPFSVESGSAEDLGAISSIYSIVEQLTPQITRAQAAGRIDAVLLDRENPESVIELGDYRFICRHDHTLGWSAEAASEDWPTVSAMLIQTADHEFLFAGTGVVITVEPLTSPEEKAGLLVVDEGSFDKGIFVPGRRLNGDQTHQGRHLRIPAGRYGIQRLTLYQFQ